MGPIVYRLGHMVFIHERGVRFPLGPPITAYVFKLRTLIIRTDRLGDFYLTLPYINSIKRKYGKRNVDILVNNHIYQHIKKKKYLYNKIYSLPKRGLLKKIFLTLKLRKKKYNQVIIFDGKDRSFLLSKFLQANKVYLTFPKKKINHITNFFFSKKYITFVDNQIIPLDFLFKKVLDSIGVKINNNDYKILLYKNINKVNFFKGKNITKKKYILLHMDEKWFSDFYIKDFTNISPTVEDFYLLIKKIIKIKKNNIAISTGNISLPFIEKLIRKYFKFNNKGYSLLKFGKYKVILFSKLSIDNLETITMNASNVIACQGPLTQISGAFNVSVIDIIEKKYKKWYFRHTSHIKKYNKLYREDFNELSKKIILKIK